MRYLFALVAAVALARPLRADEAPLPVSVNSVSGNQVSLRYGDRMRGWGEGDGICLYRGENAIACGHVLYSDAAGVTVQLSHGKNRFKPDDAVQLRENPRFTFALAQPKWDLAIGARFYLGGKDASGGDTLHTIYFAKGKYAFGRKLVLGLEPFFTVGAGGNLKIYGATLLAQYFFRRAYDRWYLGGGFGYYQVNASASVIPGAPLVNESLSSLAVRALLGYHIRFGGVFNLAFEGGTEYLTKTEGSQLSFGLAPLSGFLGFEFGWNF